VHRHGSHHIASAGCNRHVAGLDGWAGQTTQQRQYLVSSFQPEIHTLTHGLTE
jgi:hypothetical protein